MELTTKNKGGRPKGIPKTGGRVKGTPNKVTRAIKEMVIGALDEAGGMDYLVRQADENPVAFLALVGKVIPLQVNANLDSTITHVQRMIVDPNVVTIVEYSAN